MLERKLVNGHYRVMLLKTVTDRKFSEATDLQLSLIIRNCPINQRENKAQELIEIINQCSTEEEVIQRLHLE